MFTASSCGSGTIVVSLASGYISFLDGSFIRTSDIPVVKTPSCGVGVSERVLSRRRTGRLTPENGLIYSVFAFLKLDAYAPELYIMRPGRTVMKGSDMLCFT